MTQLGKYDIVEELGRGGFGVVYKARDVSLNRLVALKILHPQLTVDDQFLKRFRKEAQALASINHPNVVTIYEIGEIEGRIYIAMEYLPGGSLGDKLLKGPISLQKALKITSQVALGLGAGHAENLLHRDVKPGNILFNKRGEAVIADFGLVKALQLSSSSVLSSVGMVGTPYYRAPELWLEKSPSPATDIYSLACVLYEMLTGEILFFGETPPGVMKKHFDPINLDVNTHENIPESIEVILDEALAKDPAQRFQSMGSFVKALTQSHAKQPGNIKATSPQTSKQFNQRRTTQADLTKSQDSSSLISLDASPEKFTMQDKGDETDHLTAPSRKEEKNKIKWVVCGSIGISAVLILIVIVILLVIGIVSLGKDKLPGKDETIAAVPSEEEVEVTKPVEEPADEIPAVEEPQPEEIEEEEEPAEPEEVVIQPGEELIIIQENFGVVEGEAFVGFVMKNQKTDVSLTDVEYTINIMDGDGIILGQENNTFPWLLPEQSLGIFFRVSLDEENPLPESYNIVLEFEETSQPEMSQNPFNSEKIKIWESSYWPIVTGIVRNSNTNIYTDVRTSVLCYDAEGQIIGGGYEYIDFIPGQGQMGFSTYLDIYNTVDSIEVFPILTFMSDPYEDTPEFWEMTYIPDEYYYLSDSDEIYGGTVIQNNLDDQTLEDVIVNVTFFDDEGYVISHGSQFIDYFLPGDTLGVSPFIDDPDGITSLSYYETRVFPGNFAEDFELTENVFTVNSTELTGDYLDKVNVNFTNTYAKQVSEVDIYVLLYDASGSIIGGGNTYYDEPTPAGGTGEHEIYVYYDSELTVDSIKAWVAPSYWTDFE